MSTQPRLFFDHAHHKLWVRDLAAHLEVLAFHGEERLSQPFTYRVEFTSTEQDLAAEQLAYSAVVRTSTKAWKANRGV